MFFSRVVKALPEKCNGYLHNEGYLIVNRKTMTNYVIRQECETESTRTGILYILCFMSIDTIEN